MRKTMVLITIGGWHFAGAAFAIDGGGKVSSTAGTVKSRVFYVLNYRVVEGNVGVVEKFTRNGGASIQSRQIGSAPAATKQPQESS